MDKTVVRDPKVEPLPATAPRRPYETPRLTEHGSVQSLTQDVSGGTDTASGLDNE